MITFGSPGESPHFKLTLSPSAKSLLPCYLTYSQVAGIRAWAFWGGGHYIADHMVIWSLRLPSYSWFRWGPSIQYFKSNLSLDFIHSFINSANSH